MVNSVARGGRGAVASLLACRTKRRIRKIPCFSTSETVFCTGIDYKKWLKLILKQLFRGGRANLSKIKLINQRKKLWNIAKNRYSIWLHIEKYLTYSRFHQKIYKLSNSGGGYSVLVNYQSLLSNFLPLAPLNISFSIKHRRSKLLLESFIDLPAYDFMIDQLVKREL